MKVKIMAKTTIRNASRRKLVDYLEDMTQDSPHDDTPLVVLRLRVKEAERKTKGWFGEKITFEEWANN